MGVKVRERPKGSGAWWIFIDHQGKRKSKKIGNDEDLARDVAEKIKAKLVLGELDLSKKDNCPTFKAYAEKWLKLPSDRKESTMENYKDNLKRHVYPVIGKRRLDDLRRKDMKALLDSLLIKGLSHSTVTAIKAPINEVLSHAMDSELIESNPMRDIKTKRIKKQFDVDPLTDEETILLLDQAKKHMSGYYYPHILCALRTGMRIGEIEVLQWGDIDFNSRFIEVKRGHHKGRITGTKNKKRRRIDMTPNLAETLRALRVTQKKRALKDGRLFPEWVFANKKGEMLSRAAFMKALFRCLEASKLRKIRIHDLRHTYATIRLLRGHNPGDVSHQLGHSSISITYDVYAHWIPGKFKSEVDELDNPHPSATQAQPGNEQSQYI
ncbi:MAG: site-specific integrase [Deltaproteobacteria bacterium]|nr:site-specific integrase [Deltaproteobacteria bacterium]